MASAAGCTTSSAPRTTSLEIDGGALEPQLARHDAGHVEQFVDELRLPLGAVVDRLAGALALPSVSSRPLRSMSAQPRMALSGVRSSCDTMARNWSFSRFASSALARAARSRSSSCLRISSSRVSSATVDREAFLFLRERMLRVPRLPQRLDRLLVQPLRLRHVPLLIFEPADEDLIGAIRQVDGREHQQRLPVLAALR